MKSNWNHSPKSTLKIYIIVWFEGRQVSYRRHTTDNSNLSRNKTLAKKYQFFEKTQHDDCLFYDFWHFFLSAFISGQVWLTINLFCMMRIKTCFLGHFVVWPNHSVSVKSILAERKDNPIFFEGFLFLVKPQSFNICHLNKAILNWFSA